MLKNKTIKISISVIALLTAVWFISPKAYTSNLLQHNPGMALSIDPETKLQAPEASNLEEDYKKPVYFNIFKFVNDLIPRKR